MSIYGVIGYHVTLSEGNFDLFVTKLFILYKGDRSPVTTTAEPPPLNRDAKNPACTCSFDDRAE